MKSRKLQLPWGDRAFDVSRFFSFLLFSLFASQAIAISSCPESTITKVVLNGEQTFTGVVSGGICFTEIGPARQYNFVGKPGQKVYFEVISEQTSFRPKAYLKLPVSGVVEASGTTSARVPQTGYMTLPNDGDYWFYVTSADGKSGGQYTLKIGTDTLTPESGWWWNSAESGRGFAIEKQGNTLMVAGFLYDAAGTPTWYMAAGPMQDSATFKHTFDSFAGGQCITCPYHPPTQTAGAGDIEIKFTSGKTATLKWSGGEVALERFNFGL